MSGRDQSRCLHSDERGSPRAGGEEDEAECGDSGSPPAISVERNALSAGLAPSVHAAVDADLVARNLIAELRQENPGLQGRAVVSEPLALAFVRRYFRMVAELGVHRAQPRVVFHGTQSHNFDAIIAGNLKVPDGVTLLSATGRSTYGQGIYVASDFDIALAYGRPAREKEGREAAPAQPAQAGGPHAAAARGVDGALVADGSAQAAARALHRAAQQQQQQQQVAFVCLALPGRQHVSAPPLDAGCRAVRPNFDSHVSADRGGAISVFFDSSQLLPCFLTTRDSLICAQEAAVRAVDTLMKATPQSARGDDSSDSAGAGSTKSEPELDTQSVQNFPQNMPPNLRQMGLAWLRGTAAGAAGAALTATMGSELVAAGALPAADGAPANRGPRTATSSAPSAFATAEWDGVQKRVRYS